MAIGILGQPTNPTLEDQWAREDGLGGNDSVIANKAALACGTRFKTIKGAGVLSEWAVKCCEGPAITTGCGVEFEES
jgi:hypothetical protein